MNKQHEINSMKGFWLLARSKEPGFASHKATCHVDARIRCVAANSTDLSYSHSPPPCRLILTMIHSSVVLTNELRRLKLVKLRYSSILNLQ
jgi:hypothetical protein